MAMRSPARTVMQAPLNTCRVHPALNELLDEALSPRALVAGIIHDGAFLNHCAGFGGQQTCCAPGGVKRRDARQNEGECADFHDVRKPHMRRQIAHEINARIQEFEADHIFQTVHQCLQVDRDQYAQRSPRRRCRACRLRLPWTTKIDSTLRGEEPNVRNMAISRRLDLTTITMVDTILNAANGDDRRQHDE